MNKRILVVDDDAGLRLVLEKSLREYEYYVRAAANGHAALKILEEEPFDLLLTDLSMPKMSGIELMEKTLAKYPDMSCLVITAYGTVEAAVAAMQKGAFDFISKPFSLAQLESRISRHFEAKEKRQQQSEAKTILTSPEPSSQLLGNSLPIQALRGQIELLSGSDATVFVQGESGTGKELIARAIHESSERCDGPFLKFNCAAVPETLFESTLFGHEKGAFSGAHRMRKGVFEEADGGTLLLDEISEIPISMQAKLLRVLQEMVVTRIGSTSEIPVNVRIIATTNRDIHEMIDENKFREDLYFRLNVFPINVSPLREREGDIRLLAEHFLEKNCQKYGIAVKEVEEAAFRELEEFNWPGNVRQLQHMIERAFLLSGNDPRIRAAHMQLENERSLTQESIYRENDVCTLEEMEYEMIYRALEKTGNHRAKAAELLGISVRTLRNKLNGSNRQQLAD